MQHIWQWAHGFGPCLGRSRPASTEEHRAWALHDNVAFERSTRMSRRCSATAALDARPIQAQSGEAALATPRAQAQLPSKHSGTHSDLSPFASSPLRKERQARLLCKCNSTAKAGDDCTPPHTLASTRRVQEGVPHQQIPDSMQRQQQAAPLPSSNSTLRQRHHQMPRLAQRSHRLSSVRTCVVGEAFPAHKYMMPASRKLDGLLTGGHHLRQTCSVSNEQSTPLAHAWTHRAQHAATAESMDASPDCTKAQGHICARRCLPESATERWVQQPATAMPSHHAVPGNNELRAAGVLDSRGLVSPCE